MASIVERAGRWRALIRRKGHVRCQTFATKRDADAWARALEAQISEISARGVIQARGTTLADLIKRYTEEIYPIRPWGRTKAADLARIKADLGTISAEKLTSGHLTTYFTQRRREGSGGVVISAQLGYLIMVLRTARTLWHLDVPLRAAEDARMALASVKLITKSRRRDRRVTDSEVAALCKHFRKQHTDIPMADVVRFCLASSMRISEVCRLQWVDFDEKSKRIVVRDRKHPTDRIGNDSIVPLLAATGVDALAIAKTQPRVRDRIFPYDPKTIGSYFTRAVAALGIKDLHLHDLRHEAITRLFAAGLRIEQVALCSGHRDWAMLKRYTHVAAKDVHESLRARK